MIGEMVWQTEIKGRWKRGGESCEAMDDSGASASFFQSVVVDESVSIRCGLIERKVI